MNPQFVLIPVKKPILGQIISVSGNLVQVLTQFTAGWFHKDQLIYLTDEEVQTYKVLDS